MNFETQQIKAKDGFLLTTRLYLPENQADGIVVCNSGTCIRQDFYQKIATYLSSQNLIVLTYDYRGVGESRPKSLRSFSAKISDWGRLDMAGIFTWVKEKYPHLPKFLLAHSMGGQIIGLNAEIQVFNKIVSVASSYGNHQFYEPKFRKTTQKGLFWMQLAGWWYGYIPAKLIGGEDWTLGVSQEWREWSKYKLSFSEIARLKGWESHFERISVPFRAYFIEDDIMATPTTIPFYQQDFRNAQLEIQMIRPENQTIGHFGFFTGRVQIEVWEDLVSWLKC